MYNIYPGNLLNRGYPGYHTSLEYSTLKYGTLKYSTVHLLQFSKDGTQDWSANDKKKHNFSEITPSSYIVSLHNLYYAAVKKNL